MTASPSAGRQNNKEPEKPQPVSYRMITWLLPSARRWPWKSPWCSKVHPTRRPQARSMGSAVDPLCDRWLGSSIFSPLPDRPTARPLLSTATHTEGASSRPLPSPRDRHSHIPSPGCLSACTVHTMCATSSLKKENAFVLMIGLFFKSHFRDCSQAHGRGGSVPSCRGRDGPSACTAHAACLTGVCTVF